jgi:hypothetical protein
MSVPSGNTAKLSVVDGRLRLTLLRGHGNTKIVYYPKVQVLRNRVRVGCITVTKEAAKKLLSSPVGFVQHYDGSETNI